MFKCLHPVHFYDKHFGVYRDVPCGKCSACLNARSNSWAKRLNVEASQHKYVYFFTLTYSNDFVPIFRPEEVLEYKYCTDKQRLDLASYLVDHDASDSYLVLRYTDCQNFLKRLRNYIYDDKKIPLSEQNIRFYICGEYGPSTHRPHYHGLLFCDSDILCKIRGKRGNSRIFAYLRKAWSVPSKDGKFRVPIGRVDFQRVLDEGASKYVSSYVTSFSDLPSLLRQKPFRPFCHASKFPAIGSFKYDVEQAKKTVLNGDSRLYNKFGSESAGNVDIPLFKSLKNSLFPKVPGYSLWSASQRYALYGIARFPYLGASFSEFREWLFDSQNSTLGLLVKKCIGFSDVGSLYQLEADKNRSLVRLWRMSNCVLTNCSIFGIDLLKYVCCIDNFYCLSDYERLISQLKFEEDWVKNGFDIRYLLDFVDGNHYLDFSRPWSALLNQSFGFTEKDAYNLNDSFRFSETNFWKSYVSMNNHRVYIGKSYKAKKDYQVHGHLSNLNVK